MSFPAWSKCFLSCGFLIWKSRLASPELQFELHALPALSPLGGPVRRCSRFHRHCLRNLPKVAGMSTTVQMSTTHDIMSIIGDIRTPQGLGIDRR